MLRAVMRVQGKGHLEFVNRFRGEPREENFVQALEGIMISLQPAHTFLNGKTGSLGLGKGGEAREWRQTVERRIIRRAHDSRLRGREGGFNGYLRELFQASPRVRSREKFDDAALRPGFDAASEIEKTD